MPKPDNIRCETCVFWTRGIKEPSSALLEEYSGRMSEMPTEDATWGSCNRRPHCECKDERGFCEKWREDWAGDVDAEWVFLALRFCRGVQKKILQQGRIGAFVREFMVERERIFPPEIAEAIRTLDGEDPC